MHLLVVNYCREMYKNIFSSKWIQNKKDIAIDKGTDGIHMLIKKMQTIGR